MIPVYLMIAVAVVSMIICYLVARARSANRVFWVVMAAVLGPFAIPFVFFAKPVNPPTHPDHTG